MERTRFTHVMQLVGKNMSAIFLGGRTPFNLPGKVSDDKQAPSVLVNFKLIVRCF